MGYWNSLKWSPLWAQNKHSVIYIKKVLRATPVAASRATEITKTENGVVQVYLQDTLFAHRNGIFKILIFHFSPEAMLPEQEGLWRIIRTFPLPPLKLFDFYGDTFMISQLCSSLLHCSQPRGSLGAVSRGPESQAKVPQISSNHLLHFSPLLFTQFPLRSLVVPSGPTAIVLFQQQNCLRSFPLSTLPCIHVPRSGIPRESIPYYFLEYITDQGKNWFIPEFCSLTP